MDAIGLAVNPVLDPLLGRGVIVVEALAGSAVAAGPVFQQHTLVDDELNAAGCSASGHSVCINPV